MVLTGLVLVLSAAAPAHAGAAMPAGVPPTAAPAPVTSATPDPPAVALPTVAPAPAASAPSGTASTPTTTAPEADSSDDEEEDSKPPTGLDGALFGVDPVCPKSTGTSLDCIPIDHFDIWYDSGGWRSVLTKATGFITQWSFALTRDTIRIGIWVITYSLQFSIASTMSEPAGRAARAYQDNALAKLGIPLLCLFSSQLWSAIQITRGRLSRGFAEAATSLLISALAATLLATPNTLILGDHGLLHTTRDVALCVAAAPTGGCDTNAATDPVSIARPVTEKIKHAFVVEPNEILNTGQILDDPKNPSPCLQMYHDALVNGPWDTKGDPRKNYLRKVGGKAHDTCDKMADWNEKMTMERLVASLLVQLAAFLVCALLITIGGGLLVAQLALVTLVCLTFFAVAFGQAPGPGRAIFYSWIIGCLRAAAAVLIGIVFLSIYLFFLTNLLDATNHQPMIVRFGMLDLLVAASFMFYRRLRRASDRLSQQAGDRLRSFQPGANAPVASWMQPAAAAGGGGGGGGGGGTPWNVGRDQYSPRPVETIERAMYWRRALRRGGGRSGGNTAGGNTAGGNAARPASRLDRLSSSAARTLRFGGRAGRTATAYTVGLPVSAPRAARAVRARRQSAVAAGRRRVAATRNYAQEYRRNLGIARRAVSPSHFLNRMEAPLYTAERFRRAEAQRARARQVRTSSDPSLRWRSSQKPTARRWPQPPRIWSAAVRRRRPSSGRR
ncbi:type IV secretion system protein [Frankia sp. AgKG'84/4]|uniref:type IV secretion system protein n=1 Tax=Frankia sp. AgKG'84/4 TaxID=573490 RepID=UPI00200F83E6|nr:type IV secretion system protein [Frankia sp. AgKG'84/4]MCL9793101.1 type IV secretion system protein [Frankia sp. AgKG'84/4]